MPQMPHDTLRTLLAHPAVRIAAWGLGIALLAAGVWMVWRDPAFSSDAWQRVREFASNLSVGQVITLLCLPVLSLASTTGCFWHLMRPHGKVTYGEMWSLIASSWVLNLLPLKPGLVGRVVYHSRINQICATTSVRVLVEASGTGIVAVVLLSSLLIRARVGMVWFDAVTVVAWLACLTLGIWGLMRPVKYVPRLAGAVLFRICDSYMWVLRYGILFRAIGVDAPIETAAVVAAGAQAASYVPLVGNGLGVREWTVGVLWQRLGTGTMAGSLVAGLAADLVNRVLELIVLGPIGLLGVWMVARRVKAAAPLEAASQ